MAILSDRAAYLREIENKIKTLQFLGKHLDDATVTIEFNYSDGTRAKIEKSLFPFNLNMELRILIGDSIDYYQRVITNVNSIPDEIG